MKAQFNPIVLSPKNKNCYSSLPVLCLVDSNTWVDRRKPPHPPHHRQYIKIFSTDFNWNFIKENNPLNSEGASFPQTGDQEHKNLKVLCSQCYLGTLNTCTRSSCFPINSKVVCAFFTIWNPRVYTAISSASLLCYMKSLTSSSTDYLQCPFSLT